MHPQPGFNGHRMHSDCACDMSPRRLRKFPGADNSRQQIVKEGHTSHLLVDTRSLPRIPISDRGMGRHLPFEASQTPADLPSEIERVYWTV